MASDKCSAFTLEGTIQFYCSVKLDLETLSNYKSSLDVHLIVKKIGEIFILKQEIDKLLVNNQQSGG